MFVISIFVYLNKIWFFRHANDLILHALCCAPMVNVYTDLLRMDLVIKTLSVCPEHIMSYFDYFAAFLHPRNSINWFKAMDFIQTVCLIFVIGIVKCFWNI